VYHRTTVCSIITLLAITKIAIISGYVKVTLWLASVCQLVVG